MNKILIACLALPLWIKVSILCALAIALMFLEAARELKEYEENDYEDYDK